ncbi:hypothetical protein [Leptothoe spongobia]|uniref:Uncharacterized protein n=1 Tax=Leptothoe spongobia TAU-MAC 1115 TaxID=1967444 RepID=A0A947DI09_9CYAN|nr:hypothetical protein [Leptothoe spongobia]MBT9317375.1 hypothetical protein [Leptothoe spongobia TAU-MAC 1115]
MPKTNPPKAEYFGRATDSASALRWTEARNVMLTDNSMLDPQDPLCCMDLVVSSWQVENVQRCIKTLYQGLKWADLLEIKGGYAGQRNYGRLFLIDDPYIIGVFDDRNALSNQNQEGHRPPKTLKELIQLHNQGKGNIKTLVVFEKPNLRLANSDEKARQSYFVAETIYPALAAIVKVRAQTENLQILGYSDTESKINNDEVQLVKASSDISQKTLELSPWFIKLFRDPKQANKELLNKSPLQIFCSPNSPLNLDIDDDFCIETILKDLDLAQLDNDLEK